MRGAILRKLIAAQAAGSDSGNQQQARSHRRGLQTGNVVHHSLRQQFIPAHRRQRVQCLIQPKAAARYKVRSRLGYGKRIGQHLQRQQLLPLLAALSAVGQVPFKFVHLVVRQLPVSRCHNPFMCKFAIHIYVLPASRKFYERAFSF